MIYVPLVTPTPPVPVPVATLQTGAAAGTLAVALQDALGTVANGAFSQISANTAPSMLGTTTTVHLTQLPPDFE